MTTRKTYTEIQPWGVTVYDSENHVTFQTNRQKVDLITNPYFGRVLFLDGVLQSASSDEHIYHEALCKDSTGPFVESCLIAGGSEGAVLREVLRSKHLKKVSMVDWDEELVLHLREKESMNVPSFEDKRVSLCFQDIVEYFANCNEVFDSIVLDLLDIESEEGLEWTLLKVVNASLLHLNPEIGRIALNVGREKKYAEEIVSRVLCKRGVVETLFVPSFQEPWHLVKLSV
jgi:spermidine synthase